MFSKNLKFTFFAKECLQTQQMFCNIMKYCLANDNMEAHYIEGMMQFFHYTNTTNGLIHLKKSADGLYLQHWFMVF